MTNPSPAVRSAGPEPALQLVLAACGRRRQLSALMAQAGPELAALLALPLRGLTPPEVPSQALAGLHGPEAEVAAGWLAPLPLDPGLPLPAAGSWAEALGAWRQPCLLLLRHDELDTGRPAAAVALLRYWRAPLLGLVQWGGPWCAGERRDDGLPWLGWLPQRPEPADRAPAAADRDAGPLPGLLDARLSALLRRRLALLDSA
jgi:hypothetical protein